MFLALSASQAEWQNQATHTKRVSYTAGSLLNEFNIFILGWTTWHTSYDSSSKMSKDIRSEGITNVITVYPEWDMDVLIYFTQNGSWSEISMAPIHTTGRRREGLGLMWGGCLVIRWKHQQHGDVQGNQVSLTSWCLCRSHGPQYNNVLSQ